MTVGCDLTKSPRTETKGLTAAKDMDIIRLTVFCGELLSEVNLKMVKTDGSRDTSEENEKRRKRKRPEACIPRGDHNQLLLRDLVNVCVSPNSNNREEAKEDTESWAAHQRMEQDKKPPSTRGAPKEVSGNCGNGTRGELLNGASRAGTSGESPQTRRSQAGHSKRD
ncbi:unnamed protein product [Lota lota]